MPMTMAGKGLVTMTFARDGRSRFTKKEMPPLIPLVMVTQCDDDGSISNVATTL
ncbi:hypothetical protein DEO72_LG7g1431 [Vigna unguiculata]|uniref:Uncharacterized protein n=1 Tax=Vigna unguiculata TaxID=3917 RepID=A0A4D6MK94_VIGUN|nr:hypothetical protein DEO72_LG7g1431 [Vigna unguiculata]